MFFIKTKEKWKTIPGYKGCYQVSNMGNVRSFRNSRGGKIKPFLLKPYKVSGYPAVRVCVFYKRKTFLIHHLVLKAFTGPRPKGYCGAHLNGKRDDNRIENLQWVTYKENSDHRKIHGTMLYGENTNSAKLTDKEVEEIRKNLSMKTPIEQRKEAAKKYNICYPHLNLILKNKVRIASL